MSLNDMKKIYMNFLNLKRLALKLAILLVIIEAINTYYIYSQLEKITYEETINELRADAYKALTLFEGCEPGDSFRNNFIGTWHTYVISYKDGGFELLKSTALAEELASSMKSIVSNNILQDLVDKNQNFLVYSYKNGFDNILAVIVSIEGIDKRRLFAVSEKIYNQNFLTSQNLYRALAQTLLALGISALFFMFLYYWFGRAKDSVLWEVDNLKTKAEQLEVTNAFLANHLEQHYLVIDNFDKILNTTDSFCKLLGYKKSDIIGRNACDLLYSKDDFKLFLYENKNNPIGKTIEVRIKNRYGEDSTVCEARCENFSFKDEVSIYIFLKNITEVKALSEKIVKLNSDMSAKISKNIAYTRSILDSEPNIIWVQEKEKIVDANKAFFDMFCNSKRDLSRFETTRSSVFDLFDRVEKPDYIYGFEHKSTLSHLLAYRHKTHKAQLTKNGRQFIFKVGANYLMGDDDSFINDIFIVILTDITESEFLKEQEINLAKTSTVGKLAADITHEINTPLTYMKGSFELMKMELEDESFDKKYIQDLIVTLEDGVNRIENIVKTMRELNVKSTDNLEKVKIIDSIKTAIHMIQVRAKYLSHIYIQGEIFSLEGDFGEEFMAFGNKQKLEQVWIVLLNNALDEFQTSDLEFDSRRIDIVISKDEFFIKVLIKDNARPIPKEIIEKIFEPMFSTKTSSGMGLGLSISKKIVEDLKGVIKAYNDGGVAVFEVSLPKIK